MTGRELMEWLGRHPALVAGALSAAPVLAAVLWPAIPREAGDRNPWRHVFSVLVYLACIPGLLAATVLAYMLLFTRQNLLDVNLVVVFAPIVTMIATLTFIQRSATFERLPGFDRLSGLVVLLVATFAIALVLSRTRVWLFFGGSVQQFVVFAVLLFLALRWGAGRAFGERRAAPPATGP